LEVVKNTGSFIGDYLVRMKLAILLQNSSANFWWCISRQIQVIFGKEFIVSRLMAVYFLLVI
jgi:hypothetical protein